MSIEEEYKIARKNGYIDEHGVLSHSAMVILDEFETYLVKTKKVVTTSVLGEDFLAKINEYREIFPNMRFPSGEVARQNIQELKDKFIWFFKTYPEFTWDLVLDATQYYIIQKRLTNFQYTMSSSYFIKKMDVSKSISSKLADYCQMIKDDPSILTRAI